MVYKVTNEAGRWIKLTEESLAKYCDKPTAEGYALCYSDAAKKTLLEDEEVCSVCGYVCMCSCTCVHSCVCALVCVHVLMCGYMYYQHMGIATITFVI